MNDYSSASDSINTASALIMTALFILPICLYFINKMLDCSPVIKDDPIYMINFITENKKPVSKKKATPPKRVVVEQKQPIKPVTNSSIVSEAIHTLCSLGYKRNMASYVVSDLVKNKIYNTTEELITDAITKR